MSAPDPILVTLRRKRMAQGLSISAAGTRLGLSKAIVGMWETGIRKPHLAQVRAYANLLGVDLELVALPDVFGPALAEGGHDVVLAGAA